MDHHVSAILTKLDVTKRRDAVRRGHELGLRDPAGEVPPQPSVPVAEKGTDAGRDERRQQAKRTAKLEREAIADNGFRFAVRLEGALVAPVVGMPSIVDSS